ncbi:MAG: phospholipid carrier-dependent glycosyltransferase, partial [Chloroflexota bacterium]
MNKKTFYLLLMGLSIIGIFTVHYSTYWGAGLLDWDSFNYISSARNLADGRGYVIPLNNDKDIPMTHFPPMLPSVLAIFEVLGTDAIDAARFLNMALFGVSIVLIGITLREITKSYYFGLLGASLFVSSNTLIELHSWALSEPLLLFITLSGFLIFYKYSQ